MINKFTRGEGVFKKCSGKVQESRDLRNRGGGTLLRSIFVKELESLKVGP